MIHVRPLTVRQREKDMEVFKQGVIALVLAIFLSPLAAAQTSQEEMAKEGIVNGTIERTESDANGLYSIWFRVAGKMHEFMIKGARLENGSESNLAEGKRIQVKFKNRAHSEMDDFYTANATAIVLLKQAE